MAIDDQKPFLKDFNREAQENVAPSINTGQRVDFKSVEQSRESNVRPNTKSGSINYARRISDQNYHPVILVGSASSGKTVLLLSLISYIKNNRLDGLTIIFGSDFYARSEDENFAAANAEAYFDRSVANFISGESETATKLLEGPLIVPVKVCKQDGTEFKFAFVESDGEWYHPNWKTENSPFRPRFPSELEELVGHYAEGITFIWVAPHMATNMPSTGVPTDAHALIKNAAHALQCGLENYSSLRTTNSSRDTHLLLVTKWDTAVTPGTVTTLSQVIDPRRALAAHEVDDFINKYYSGAAGAFGALTSPESNKKTFHFTAGTFNERQRGVGLEAELLNLYPKTIWNWLYSSMKVGHDWPFLIGDLIPTPKPPPPTIFGKVMAFLRSIMD